MSGPGGDGGVVVGADVVLSLVESSLVGSSLVGTSVVVPSVGGALVSGTAVVVSLSVLVTEGLVTEAGVAGVRECGCEITRGCASATGPGAVLVARAGEASSEIEITAAPAAANTRIRRARGR
jgi:hypothetical protein